MTLTSLDSPIRVDFVPGDVVGLPGRLGMTIAPGKKASGLGGTTWVRDTKADLTAIRDVFGGKHLVTLMELWELERFGISDLFDAARSVGLSPHHVPIVDGGVPRSVEVMIELVDHIVGALRRGENVVIHCRGGLGRTGTAAAACLVGRGLGAEAAIAAVRAARAGTVENERQERFVEQFAARARGRWA